MTTKKVRVGVENLGLNKTGTELELMKQNSHLRSVIEKKDVALKLAIDIADSWIHDQLDGTSSLNSALKELQPAKEALEKGGGV